MSADRSLRFPNVRAEDRSEPSAGSVWLRDVSSPEPSGPAHLLIVDDEPHICAILRRVLTEAGYGISEARDGDEAIDILESGTVPDLILSDLMMPRVDGMELLDRAKAIDDTIGFVILTGAGTVENAVEALRLQADDYLLKPFNLDEVTLSVERVLERRRLIRQNRFYQAQLEERVAQQADQLESMFVEALLTLANAIEARDGDTGDHVERVTRYAVATGRELGLRDEELRHLWVAALLHDVGKIGVPDRILTKPSALTSEEYRAIQNHPEIGAAILGRSNFLRPALPGVLHHQERWDGTGYPAGLAGEEISMQGRILAVADAFDAMISDRAYRARRSAEVAEEELRRCAGTQFDPKVVDAFLRSWRRAGSPDPAVPRFPEAMPDRYGSAAG